MALGVAVVAAAVEVVRSLQARRVLTAEDVIDRGDVLPGFSCRVDELFG